MEAGRAPNTLKKYKKGWEDWSAWASRMGNVSTCPADPYYVAIYLCHILQTHGTKGALICAMYGIRWGHHMAGEASPTDDPSVQLAFDGCTRTCARPTKKKEPLTIQLLKELIESYDTNPASLKKLRFLAMIVTGFAGFLRIDEILSIKVNHLQFHDTHVQINIEKSKTDQTREGNVIHIARLDSRYCPVKLIEKFLEAADLHHNPNAFIIPRLVATKSGAYAHKTLGISYTTAREEFMLHMRILGEKGKNLSTHSLRAGGASEAACNKVSDRLISKHGRWKSTRARNGYIKDNLQNRLSITRNLGL